MKKPNLARAPSIGRALAELTIIVAGVLIALGAQAWWEERGVDEDRERAEALIADDLVALQASLEDRLDGMDSIRSSVEWFLDEERRLEESDIELYRRRSRLAFWEMGSVRVSFPAYDDLKGSGRLSLLPADVRRHLTWLDATLALLRQGNEDVFVNQTNNLDSWLIEVTPMRDMLEYDPGPVDGPLMPREVARSVAAENRLLIKHELLGNVSLSVRESLQAIDSVFAALNRAP